MVSSLLTLLLLPFLTLAFPLAPPQHPLVGSSSSKESERKPILPTCSSLTFSSPCKCPEGTSYESTTTYAVIGANAKDVQAVTGNFFDITWLGMVPRETAGPPNSTLRWDTSPDGSFETAYKQQNTPIPYKEEFGPGAFAGELVTWTAEYLGEHETAVTCENWSRTHSKTKLADECFSGSCYVCFTGGLNGKRIRKNPGAQHP
ncbi:MAG: hypothetical protein Q9166_004887 [cf. Caloplaca sp. 2 TL-2023]